MLFTIPYNGSNPDDFLKRFEPYKDIIHSFYFGMPGLFISHTQNHCPAEKILEFTANTYRFMELCKDKYKTVLCINSMFYPEQDTDLRFKILKEFSDFSSLGLTAVNVASPAVAKIVHDYFPRIEIQTSCNTFAYLGNMYRLWNEEFGTTVFNLPREALRLPNLLTEFKKTGFVSKCILNETCIFACPAQAEHSCVSMIAPGAPFFMMCERKNARISDIFKSNFIPPHRLKEYDDRLDIAKIAGRWCSTDWIENAFKAYRTGDPNVEVSTIMHGRNKHQIELNHLRVLAKDWPKKTMTCECKECGTCQICEKAMLHVAKRCGVNLAQLTRQI